MNDFWLIATWGPSWSDGCCGQNTWLPLSCFVSRIPVDPAGRPTATGKKVFALLDSDIFFSLLCLECLCWWICALYCWIRAKQCTSTSLFKNASENSVGIISLLYKQIANVYIILQNGNVLYFYHLDFKNSVALDFSSSDSRICTHWLVIHYANNSVYISKYCFASFTPHVLKKKSEMFPQNKQNLQKSFLWGWKLKRRPFAWELLRKNFILLHR